MPTFKTDWADSTPAAGIHASEHTGVGSYLNQLQPVLPRAVPRGTLLRSYTFADGTTGGFALADSASAMTVATPPAIGSRTFSPALRFTYVTTSLNSLALEAAGTPNVADGEFLFHFRAAQTGSMEPEIYFRSADASNGYMMTFRMAGNTSTPNTIQLYKRVTGTFTSLATATVTGPGLPASQWLRCLIRFVGPEIEVYVNDVLTGMVIDSTYTTGRVGLGVFTGQTAGASTYFDNISVYSLPSNYQPGG